MTGTTRLLSTPEAAELLGISPGTMIVWRSNQRVNLPYIKLSRSVKYRLEDLDAFISSNTISN